jgi:ankyrin repeat protein
MKYFKLWLYIIVLYISFPVFAGTYDDFFKALKEDNAQVVARVLARGFDPNTLNPEGLHPLVLAIRRPSPAALGLLLQAKSIQVEYRNAAGESPLMLAAMAGMVDVCKRLIALDADVNKTGWTPLHYASAAGQVAVIHLLLDHSAYIDAESPNKSTPLMMAAMYSDSEAVRLLLDEGADATLKNEKGLTALDFAQAAGKEASARLIAMHLDMGSKP